MNDHLEPIFKIILPSMKQAGINYWVFGGISISAYVGYFFRNNVDVDVFVLDEDFKNAMEILEKMCRKNNFLYKRSGKKDERPKFEIKIDGVERFSVIPVYKSKNIIIFEYNDGNQRYSCDILKREENNLSGFKFYSPSKNFIKEMFLNHIKARPDKVTRKKIIMDAERILTKEEFEKIF